MPPCGPNSSPWAVPLLLPGSVGPHSQVRYAPSELVEIGYELEIPDSTSRQRDARTRADSFDAWHHLQRAAPAPFLPSRCGSSADSSAEWPPARGLSGCREPPQPTSQNKPSTGASKTATGCLFGAKEGETNPARPNAAHPQSRHIVGRFHGASGLELVRSGVTRHGGHRRPRASIGPASPSALKHHWPARSHVNNMSVVGTCVGEAKMVRRASRLGPRLPMRAPTSAPQAPTALTTTEGASFPSVVTSPPGLAKLTRQRAAPNAVRHHLGCVGRGCSLGAGRAKSRERGAPPMSRTES
jgi:hypothetical protein